MRHSSKARKQMRIDDAKAIGQRGEKYCVPPRKWCTDAHKEKSCFPNYTAALNFLQETVSYASTKQECARSIYFCHACRCWHLTHYIPETLLTESTQQGFFVGGKMYVPVEAEDGVDPCAICDRFMVKRCTVTGIMPCLAYKGDKTYFKRLENLTIVRNAFYHET